jgi:hypothetical protein
VHALIDAPGYWAHAVGALAAHVSGVQLTPPLLLPLLLLPVLLLLPPPEQATPPATPKQIGAPAAKQQSTVGPSALSTHDCTAAPGYPAHAVEALVAQVGVVQVTPPLLLLAPLLLLLPPHTAPTVMLAHAPLPLLAAAQSANVPTRVVVPETVCAVALSA